MFFQILGRNQSGNKTYANTRGAFKLLKERLSDWDSNRGPCYCVTVLVTTEKQQMMTDKSFIDSLRTKDFFSLSSSRPFRGHRSPILTKTANKQSLCCYWKSGDRVRRRANNTWQIPKNRAQAEGVLPLPCLGQKAVNGGRGTMVHFDEITLGEWSNFVGIKSPY